MVITIVLSDAMLLARSVYCLPIYETDVKLYCAWSSFLELVQAHCRYNLFLLKALEKRDILCLFFKEVSDKISDVLGENVLDVRYLL